MIKHDKFWQSSLDSGWCLSSVPRQSGGYFRYAQRHVRTVFNCAILVIDTPVVVHVEVVDFPVMTQMTFSLVSADLEISQLHSVDQVFDVLVAQVLQIVRSRGYCRQDSCCMPVVCNDMWLWSITLQFIDSCERPCDHTATVVQWQSLRFSSSSESWTDQLCNSHGIDFQQWWFMWRRVGFLTHFASFFALLRLCRS